MNEQDIADLKYLAENERKLTPAGKAKLEELRASLPGQPGFLQRQAIFAGRGALDTYQGAKQKYLQMTDPEAAGEYTAGVNRGISAYEPLAAAYPTESALSRFIGNAASVPVPGMVGTLPTRLAGSTALGGIFGGMQFDPENQASNTVQNALYGAGGAGLLEGLSSAARAAFKAKPGGRNLPSVSDYSARDVLPPSAGYGVAEATAHPRRTYDFRDSEFGIPYTEGQATGDVTRQQFEQRMAHNAFGEPAGADIRQLWDYQARRATDAMRETGEDLIQGDRSGKMVRAGDRGGRAYQTVSDAGEELRSRLSTRANELWRNIGDVFKIARDSGARLSANDARGVVDRVIGSVDPYDAKAMSAAPKSYPKVTDVEAQLRAFVPEGVDDMEAEGLHAMRRILSENRASKDISPNEKRILGGMIEELDQQMLDLVDTGRLIGPERAITAMQEGIRMRADYGKLYGPKRGKFRSGRNKTDKAGAAIERIIEDDLSGEDVANLVFGRGRLGSSENTVKIIQRVKRAAGDQSEEAQALRNMAMEKLRHEVTTAGKDVISPDKLASHWRFLRERRTDLLSELYTRKEIEKIDRLVAAVGKTRYADEAMNRSKTAHMLEAMFNSVPMAVGAAAGGAAGGPLGAAGGAAGMWVAKSIGQDIKNLLGKLYGVRVFENMPRAVPPSIGAAAAGRLKQYVETRNTRRQGDWRTRMQKSGVAQ